MSRWTDDALYRRGIETLVGSWEEYARAAGGASLRRLPGVTAAVFPHEPERSVYNNALLALDLPAAGRARALDGMESAYATAGVGRFAAWVHERDAPMRRDLERRGYALDASTRAMGMALADLRAPRPELDLAPPELAEHLRLVGVPPGFLRGADGAGLHVLVARVAGESVATAIAHDVRGDCGVYNVGTLERARRRGLATAVTALLLHDAMARGCTTASLQATAMAERLYSRLGFRDLGRILEYVPAPDVGNRVR
jgi:ribosomal protein S18 acetylase RimI-like enzyme